MRHSILTTLLTAVIVTALWPGSAIGHLGNVSYSDIAVEGDTVYYRIKFAAHLIPAARERSLDRLTRRDVIAMEADILAWISEKLPVSSSGQACPPTIEDSRGPDGNDDLSLVLAFKCPHPPDSLRIEFNLFEGALDQFQNIVSFKSTKTSLGYVFTEESRLLLVGEDKDEESVSAVRRFFVLGVEHILSGYDHLLFLLALLLPGGTLWQLAGIITAFTIAHSITLTLATLGLVNIPPAPVEVAIAASIVYVAASNLRAHIKDHRRRVTFAFGLIHGFGFASMLTAAGLPPQDVFTPLLSFNLGVEAGQFAVVLVTVPLIDWSTRSRAALRIRSVGSWFIIAAGLFWMSQRMGAVIAMFSG